MWGNLTWETKGKEKRHTNTESGASAKDVRGSDLSSSAQGIGTSFRGHTHIADSFHRWLCIQRQARSEWTDENDLKQRVIYTTHPPHNTQRFEFYSSYGCKMQSNRAPRPKRNTLVKHCYWWFEVNIKPVPRCHFVNYNIAEVWTSKANILLHAPG